MPGTIRKIEKLPSIPKLKRVAAYARVSSEKDAMLHSLYQQVSFYSNLIQSHDGWEYVGVYADEAKTGTKDSRENFQRLLSDCRAGKIDMVITKSISRFARNTVTLLEAVRELKAIGIDVYFEEQNIHTASADGELMLTILASYAQEESRSVSENQKWRIKRNFEEGKPWRFRMLGYKHQNGEMVIVPEEAEIVRSIFRDYLAGDGVLIIANRLNSNGVSTITGGEFTFAAIVRILENYDYTGNLILQKKYRENHLTKRTLINNGELPKYHVTDSHEAIISVEDFERVQEERKIRAAKYSRPKTKSEFPFTGLMVCAGCGKNYRRKATHTGPIWICPTYNFKGKSACPSKAVPENILMDVTASVLGLDEFDEDLFAEAVSKMIIESNNHIVYYMNDGTEIRKTWKDRSRSESWTPEMKEAARQTTIKQRRAQKCRE